MRAALPRKTLPFTALSLLLLVACGDDADTGTLTDGGVGLLDARAADSGEDDDDAGSAPSLSASDLCALLEEKAASSFCQEGEEDTTLCEQQRAQSIARCAAIVDAVDAGRIRYDGRRAHACVAGLDDMELGLAFRSSSLHCEDVFSGLVPDGDDCYFEYGYVDNECESGAYCDQSTGACPGRCRPYQSQGDACPSAGRCAPDLACMRDCTPPCEGTCEPKPEIGEDCERSYGVCAGELVCDASGTSQVCIERLALGDDCTRGYQCASFNCIDGKCTGKPERGCDTSADCDASETCKYVDYFRCVPRIAAGEPCDAEGDDCVEGYVCPTHWSGGTSVCRERAGIDGDPCDPWACEEDHYCADEGGTQVCRPDLAMGASCLNYFMGIGNANSPCQPGLHCMLSNTLTCLPPGGMDEPCYYNDTESCELGLVCLEYALSTCKPPSALGEACNPAFENACSEGFCFCTKEDDDTCTWSCEPKLENGEVCEQPTGCASGYCDFSVTTPLCAEGPEQAPPPMLCLP